ncbi:MAG: hypothetical protein J0G28_03330 [Afipia sp.]|nr:hypothetical protein [Afipia sp.]OJW61646.1 MAG: hypothetical protein BGO65_09690 [Afipia sp. 64-13]
MMDLIQIGMVTTMSDPRFGDGPQMDHFTSIAVCNGIGERLRDIMKPGAGHLPPRLQDLMDQLQRIEDAPSIVPQLD